MCKICNNAAQSHSTKKNFQFSRVIFSFSKLSFSFSSVSFYYFKSNFMVIKYDESYVSIYRLNCIVIYVSILHCNLFSRK